MKIVLVPKYLTLPLVKMSWPWLKSLCENSVDFVKDGIWRKYSRFGFNSTNIIFAVNFEKTHPQQKLPGHKFTSRQMFWISYGQVMCAKYKDGFLKHLLKTSEHPSGEFRINGPLSNNPDFANDFKCPTGSPMNPADKCKLW